MTAPQAAHAGLALKNPFGSGGFVEYTVADTFKAGATEVKLNDVRNGPGVHA